MKRLKIGIIYKITYPNGKIYIGQDRTNDINYFGSADSFTIAKDFNGRQRKSFVIQKDILEELKDCTVQELNQCERKHISLHNSMNQAIGYNRDGVARRRCTEVWK